MSIRPGSAGNSPVETQIQRLAGRRRTDRRLRKSCPEDPVKVTTTALFGLGYSNASDCVSLTQCSFEPAVPLRLFFSAIPILVHLFNFRRYKKVLFTNVRFQEIRQDTQNRSRLRNCSSWLPPAAVTFLVLAFAQPYLLASTAAKRDG